MNEERPEEKNLPELITYRNPAGGEQKPLVLPAIYVADLYRRHIEIQDSADKHYQLPDVVQERFDELMEAHQSSVVYNQTNIRVDQWRVNDDRFLIETSRTTYFDSLVTNRAMDYKWSNGLSVRSVLDYGPFVHELEESNLSNHLGFNGFTESSDNMIMFMKRGKHLSVGKNIYGTSVGASLKARYALADGKDTFSREGLKRAICGEILDECKINYSVERFSLEENVFAAYRDLIEGGKPQLLFYLHLDDWTREQIDSNFARATKKIKNKKNATTEDGFHFLWIPREELYKVTLGENYMIYQNRKYPIGSSSIASIVLLLKHLNVIEHQ